MIFSLKFFPFKDFIFSIVPTVASYEGYLKGLIPLTIFPNKYIALIVGFAVSLILAIIFHNGNIRTYKRSLAEILATGYFMNFTGRLAKLLKGKVPIEFSFPDGSVIIFPPDKIKIEIAMPRTLNSLTAYSNEVEAKSDIVYIRESTRNEPYWVRAIKANGSLSIYEYPRTLFALSKYLKRDFSDKKQSEKNSKKIYKYFDKKIEELKIEYSKDIPTEKLEFKYV